jgi:hypothetical protein
VSADLIDELSLPPDMLPSSTDMFAPAGSFVVSLSLSLSLSLSVSLSFSFSISLARARSLSLFLCLSLSDYLWMEQGAERCVCVCVYVCVYRISGLMDYSWLRPSTWPLAITHHKVAQSVSSSSPTTLQRGFGSD